MNVKSPEVVTSTENNFYSVSQKKTWNMFFF